MKRNENGKRLYDEEDLSWIHFVTALRATGMPIAQIQKYVYLYKEGDSTISERKKMMQLFVLSVQVLYPESRTKLSVAVL